MALPPTQPPAQAASTSSVAGTSARSGAAVPVSAGQGALAPSALAQSVAGVPGANAASGAVQQVSAQQLLSLLQTLGRPLQGQVTTGGSSTSLPLQVALPSGGATGAIATNLPLDQSTQPPRAGTAVQVDASGAGSAPKLTVTVLGQARVGQAGLGEDQRMQDAARQGSLAPLLADVAALTRGAGRSSGAMNNALQQILGFTLDGDATVEPARLQNLVEGGRALPTSASRTGGQASQSQSQSQGLQNAVAGLIRALGIVPAPEDGASLMPTAQNAAGARAQTTSPLPEGSNPSRLPAAALPLEMPDLADPAVLQALKSKAEAALSRLNLMQASEPQASRAGDAGPALRWDVPLLIGQEAGVLGVAIDRDGSAETSQDPTLQSWRFRFAFESQRLGGVEGLVALHRPRQDKESARPSVDIGVWVDDPALLDQLDKSRADLVLQLQALDVQVDSLTLETSAQRPLPQTAADEASSHMVDVAT